MLAGTRRDALEEGYWHIRRDEIRNVNANACCRLIALASPSWGSSAADLEKANASGSEDAHDHGSWQKQAERMTKPFRLSDVESSLLARFRRYIPHI